VRTINWSSGADADTDLTAVTPILTAPTMEAYFSHRYRDVPITTYFSGPSTPAWGRPGIEDLVES
jgi:hypothetical protein